MKKINRIILLIFISFSFVFSADIDIEKQKKERELADRISSEIRRNFFDIRFLVNVEINLTEEEQEGEEQQDLMLPGVTGFQSSPTEKIKLNIANIVVKILAENKISSEDKNLIEEIAVNSGKLNKSRGDVIDIQLMNFPALKTRIEDDQNTQFERQLEFIRRGYMQLDSMRFDQQRTQVDELKKEADDLQRSLLFRDTVLAEENRTKLNRLQVQLDRADSLLKAEQDKRIANLESSIQNKGVDPLVWGLVGLSVILLMILLILLFALLSKKKREDVQQYQDYQQQIEQGQQAALPGTESSEQPQLLESTISEMNENTEYEKIKNNLITNIAGESSNVASTLKSLMLDTAQKNNLQIIVNQLGSILLPVLKEYFNVDELKTLQDISLEKSENSLQEKKDALSFLQTQLNIKRFENERQSKQNPFAFLEKLSEPQLYLLMKDETPGIIAIIISQLPSAVASSLIKGLPTSQQGEVAVELGKLKRMTSDTYISVAKKLSTKAAKIPVINNVQLQGSDLLLEIFDNLDETSEESIVDFIQTVNLDLYKEISSQRIGFGSLHLLEDKLLRQLVKDIDNEEMAIALKNASQEVVDKFYSVLPTKQRTMLEDKIAGIKKITPDEELKARRRITRMVRTYVKSGLGSLEGLQQAESVEPQIETTEEIITPTEEKTEENS